jgi:pullulanase/glycogen debranching enzyme
MSIYEVHLGSWRRKPEDGQPLADLGRAGRQLVPYAQDMGFTHLELLPVSEHPFDGSWGYQPVGLYRADRALRRRPPASRASSRRCHAAGLGVLLDWVPAHFPDRRHGLARFDGTAPVRVRRPARGLPQRLEHADLQLRPHRGAQLPGRQRAVLAGALRRRRPARGRGGLDAVPRLQPQGRRVDPQRHGGRENLEAIAFLKRMNEVVGSERPRRSRWPRSPPPSRPCRAPPMPAAWAFTTSGTWAGCTTRCYMARDPVHRKHHHDEMTFGLVYAFSENFVLPLSHDEVVHGKGSLLGKMPGDRWQKFANLRAYYGFMWGHPGKKLLFMGCEFAQGASGTTTASLDWHLLDDPAHAGVQRLVRDLNRLLPPARPCTSRTSRRRLRVDRPRTMRARCCLRAPGRDRQRWCWWCATSPRWCTRLPPGRARAPGTWRERLNTDSPTTAAAMSARRTARPGASRWPATASRSRSCMTCRRWPPCSSNGRPERPPPGPGRGAAEATPWPLGATGTATASTSPCSRRTRSASSCACSTRTGRPNCSAPPLPGRTGDVWHGYLPGARPGLVYGCARTAPGGPTAATASTRTSCCSTPGRARSSAASTGGDEHFRRRPATTRRPDPRDNAATALKARVVPTTSTGATTAARTRRWPTPCCTSARQGLHRLHPGVPEALRGTYAGLATRRHRPPQAPGRHRREPAAGAPAPGRERLVQMGLSTTGATTRWASSARSRAGQPTRTGRAARRVPRHGEGRCTRRHRGAARCGLQPHGRRRRTRPHAQLARPGQRQLLPAADTTASRTTRTTAAAATRWTSASPRVLRLVMDSLRYWVHRDACGRLPLRPGPVLGRGDHGFDRDGAFFTAVAQDPVLSRVKMIAEPWDVGPGGYQVGVFPRGWLEWNDKFRDTCAPSGWAAPCTRGEFALRLCGSSDLFQPRQRPPAESVNYVVSHDGFTLRDLVSYNMRHNEANGEDNRDGHGHNLSNNCGVEGPTDDPAVLRLRARLQRALLATHAAGPGHADAGAGDELGHTQAATTTPTARTTHHLDRLAAGRRGLIDFTARLLALRRRRCPWPTAGTPACPTPAACTTWPGCAHGEPMTTEALEQPASRVLGCLIGAPGRAAAPLLLLVNAANVRRPLRAAARRLGGLCWTAPTRRPRTAGARARSRLLQPTVPARSGRRDPPSQRPAPDHQDRPPCDSPAPAACCCTPPPCPARTAAATSGPLPTTSSTGWWRRPALWQILPLGGIGPGNSPYMSSSAFAGNVLLIDLAELQQRGWLVPRTWHPAAGLMAGASTSPHGALPHGAAGEAASALCQQHGTPPTSADFAAFWQRAGQLAGRLRAVHGAVRSHRLARLVRPGPTAWPSASPPRWPRPAQARRRIAFWQFCQWCFFRQWAALRALCQRRGVRDHRRRAHLHRLPERRGLGQPDLFELDAKGARPWWPACRPTTSAPPASAGATRCTAGTCTRQDGYAWWIERMRRTFELVDIVRIDHFRGFAGYWEIPASEPTASTAAGCRARARRCSRPCAALGPLPIIAEDLGVITPTSRPCATGSASPACASCSSPLAATADRYLPHNYEPDSVVYTGTHDNDTTCRLVGHLAAAYRATERPPCAAPTWAPTATTSPGT